LSYSSKNSFFSVRRLNKTTIDTSERGRYVSLVPAFELGLWNAWILALPFLLTFLLGKIVNKEKFEEVDPQPEKEKILLRIYIVVLVVLLVYPIFLPLKLDTAFFFVGFLPYLVGMIFCITAETNFATTPTGRPVTRGVYRISRNPMYFGSFLLFIGIGIICASWIYVLLAIVYIILADILVNAEERFCLEKYDNPYREYKNRTPKWIGLPKSRKDNS